MTSQRREVIALVVSSLALAACTANAPITRTGEPDPTADGGVGGGSSADNLVDATATTPMMPDAGSPCAFQSGTYSEVFATADSTCPAIASEQLVIGPTGAIDPGTGCTSSATAGCVTTISCSDPSGSMSTFVVTTGGVTATGTETIDTVTSAPAGCGASIFCPGGYCLYGGFCYPDSSSQTCTYTVTLTRM